MADNIPQVDIPPNEWIDLYAATGIAVGTQLNIENVGNSDINLTVQVGPPSNDNKSFNVLKRPPSVNMQNAAGDSGAWAYSQSVDGRVAISSVLKNGFIPATDVRLTDSAGFRLDSFVDVFTGERTLSVYSADLNYDIVNRFFRQDTAVSTTLTVPVVGDGSETSITVADSTGFVEGGMVNIGQGSATQESTLHTILNITPVAPFVFTLDRRLHSPHSIGDVVVESITDMASKVATLAAPETFIIKPPPGELWHITRLLFEMTHMSAGDLGRFGNIPSPGLTNGVCVRSRAGGKFALFENWKTNSDIKVDMFDVEFDSRAGGQGDFGTTGRLTFLNFGIVVRLDGDTNDQFEAIIQDDITSLDSFRIKAQGKIAVL